ncbi:MAG: TolC family protein [Gammaproteobacteria bacterium]|nr:TolC family protein [Gammaproteobacteria bacterium]
MRLNYIVACLLFPSVLLAEQVSKSLPDPLTLDYVLSLASDNLHYDVLQADAMIVQADARLQQAESAYALEADINIKARWADPSSLAFDQSKEDHSSYLSVRKPLYDFGQTASNISAAEIEKQSVVANLEYQLGQRKIDIARAFFNVLLADYQERWDNEQVVITWVNHEAEKDRHALGEISDVELLKIRTRLELLESQRSISRSQQYSSRVNLAEVINRPGQLSSNLELPQLTYDQRPLPDYDSLVNQLETFNQPLKLQFAKVDAAEKRLQSAQKQNRPVLSAEVTMSEHERESAARNDWAAELTLTVPLLEHQGMQAKIARARSQWLSERALLLKQASATRQALLNLCQDIKLLGVQKKQLTTEMQYHELELDRNRTLYEMEVATNFGTAMVAISETRYKQLKTDFELALAWMNLELMFNSQINFDEADNE